MKALLVLVLSAACASAALPDRPASGRVLDQTGALSAAGKARIQGVSDELESRTGAQLAVAVVSSLDGMDPADYANRLFRAWGVGEKGKDDGVLILLCPAERKSRIEVGYGLEAKLPDVVAGRILKDELRPFFQAGKFEDGLLEGARRVDEIISGQPASAAPPPRPRPSGGGGAQAPLLFVIPFFSMFILIGGAAIGAGLGSASAGGGSSSVFMPIWGSVFSGIPLAMAYAAVGGGGFGFLGALWLLAIAAAFRYGRGHPQMFKNSGGGGTISGSSWSSGDSGGSDFGGGSSGGGGASDSW